MNGDGLQDLVRVDGAGVTYWPYLGNAAWAAPVDWRTRRRCRRRFDPDRLFLSDIDGDGCADLVYVDAERVLYWLNWRRHAVEHPSRWPTPRPPEPTKSASRTCAGAARPASSGPSPGRRDGAPTSSSTSWAAQTLPPQPDRQRHGPAHPHRLRHHDRAGRPGSPSRPAETFLPFPVHCVVEVERCEATTGQCQRSRYRYGEARYDPDRRAFLQRVEVEQEGDDSIATLLTRSVFHVGLDPDAPERASLAPREARVRRPAPASPPHGGVRA